MPKTRVLSNLESVGDMVGALKGISEGFDEPSYLEGLIKEAHGDAASMFDIAAASAGAAGPLRHVFEFGTTGVTKGPAKFHDPTDSAARLWVHQMQGIGGRQNIMYTFRPALNRNPKPTTQETGVANVYLRKLSQRKYIFWNKAFVMETGQPVEIKSRQQHGMLFVPFNNKQANNPLNRKGFVMWNTHKLGPLVVTPGQNTKGNFTTFWMNWWGVQGQNVMEESMRRNVTMDIERAEVAIEKEAAAKRALKPVQATNIIAASRKSQSKFANMMKAIGKKRHTRVVR
jgi:hypothetical protein